MEEVKLDEIVKVSHLPMSKRKRARLDQRTKHQKNYRSSLVDKKAPNREHFARAALTVALILYEKAVSVDDKAAGLVLADTLRLGIAGNLEHLGFDPDQIKIRFDKMAERAVQDRERWRVKREWKAEVRAQK
jgi:hypothetical protein